MAEAELELVQLKCAFQQLEAENKAYKEAIAKQKREKEVVRKLEQEVATLQDKLEREKATGDKMANEVMEFLKERQTAEDEAQAALRLVRALQNRPSSKVNETKEEGILSSPADFSTLSFSMEGGSPRQSLVGDPASQDLLAKLREELEEHLEARQQAEAAHRAAEVARKEAEELNGDFEKDLNEVEDTLAKEREMRIAAKLEVTDLNTEKRELLEKLQELEAAEQEHIDELEILRKQLAEEKIMYATRFDDLQTALDGKVEQEKELRENVKNTQDEKSALQSLISERAASEESLQSTVSRLQIEVEAAKREGSAAEEKEQALRAEVIPELEDRITNLVAQLGSQKLLLDETEEIQRLRLDEFADKLEAVTVELTKERELKDLAERDRKASEERATDLQLTLSTLEESKTHEIEQLHQQQMEIDSLKSTLNTLTTTISEQSEEMSALKKKLVAADSETRKAGEQLETAFAKQNDLSAQLVGVFESRKRIEEDLTVQTSTANHLSIEVDNVKNFLGVEESKVSELTRQLEKGAHDLKSLRESCTAQVGQIAELTAQSDKVRAKLQERTAMVEELSKQLAAAVEEKQRLDAKRVELETELKLTKGTTGELDAAASKLRDDLTTATAEAAKAKGDFDSQSQKVAALEKQVSMLESEKAELSLFNSDLQSQLSATNECFQQAEERLLSLRKELGQRDDRIVSLEGEMTTLRSENEAGINTTKMLKAELDDTRQSSDSVNQQFEQLKVAEERARKHAEELERALNNATEQVETLQKNATEQSSFTAKLKDAESQLEESKRREAQQVTAMQEFRGKATAHITAQLTEKERLKRELAEQENKIKVLETELSKLKSVDTGSEQHDQATPDSPVDDSVDTAMPATEMPPALPVDLKTHEWCKARSNWRQIRLRPQGITQQWRMHSVELFDATGSKLRISPSSIRVSGKSDCSAPGSENCRELGHWEAPYHSRDSSWIALELPGAGVCWKVETRSSADDGQAPVNLVVEGSRDGVNWVSVSWGPGERVPPRVISGYQNGKYVKLPYSKEIRHAVNV